MEAQVVNMIVMGLVSWTTLFLLVRISLQSRSFDFCNRLVSILHAALAVVLSSLSVQDWSCPTCPVAAQPSLSQVRALAASLSYLVYDLVCCLFHEGAKLDNTIHHLVSIVGIGAGLAYQKSGSELVVALWITEISSPLLHLRELLKELGYRDTDLNLAVDILFAVVFSFARMIVGPYLATVTLSADNPVIVKVMAVGLQAVSAFWFCKIARMVTYKLSKRTKATIVSKANGHPTN